MAIGANCSDGHASHDPQCPACVEAAQETVGRAVQAERDACAAVCDEVASLGGIPAVRASAAAMARAIRDREPR